MNHVVITGADGFIGSHLTRYFSEHETVIYAIVSPKSKTTYRIQDVQNVKIIPMDLENYFDLVNKIPLSPLAVFHLAWSGVSPEDRNCTEEQVKNLQLALWAVRLAHAIQAKRFVFPGSTFEYSYCGSLINRKAIPSPQNAYGATKISARYLCESLCKELGVPYIYTVITGIYGPDRLDNNVITYTIKQLLLKSKPSYTSLEQEWDYIHIDDLVAALFLIAYKGRAGAFYSIGHGDNWPLYNYIKIIRDIIDPSLPLGIGELPYSNAKLPSSCIDLEELKRDTGFSPRIPFEEGITEVIKSISNFIRLQEGE